MAISLSIFGGIVSTLVAAFRVKKGSDEEEWKVVRARASSSSARINVVRNREEGIIPGVLSFFIAVLLILEIGGALPEGGGFTVGTVYKVPHFPPLTLSSSGAGLVRDILLPFHGDSYWEDLNVSCTDLQACSSKIEEVERTFNLSCGSDDSEWRKAGTLMNQLSGAQFGTKARFSLRGMMRVEEIVILSIAILKICANLGGYWYSVFDDVGMALVGAESALISISIPFRVTEMRAFSFDTGSLEWFVPLLSVLIALDAGLSFYLRLYLKLGRQKTRWKSREEMKHAFQCSFFDDYDSFMIFHGYKGGVSGEEDAWMATLEPPIELAG